MSATYPSRWRCVCLSTLLFYFPLVSAGLVNRTIDDEYGDSVSGEKLVYYPPDASSFKQGRNCTSCTIHLDTSLTWRGTWHDCTQHDDDPEVRSITAKFTGTAVYVYNVLSAYLYGPEDKNLTVTYLTFEIDGHAIGEYFSDTYDGEQYGIPVLAHEGPAHGPHTLVIRVPPGPHGRNWSFSLFDYIVYTTADDAANSMPPSISPSVITTDDSATTSLSTTNGSTPRDASIPFISLPISSTPSTPLTSHEPPSATSASPTGHTPHTHVSSGVIAGATVGGTSVVVVSVVLLFFVHGRRTRHATRISPWPYLIPKEHPSPQPERIVLAPPIADELPPAGPNVARAATWPERIAARLGNPSGGAGEGVELRARVAELRQQVVRMQELIEAPPEYASEA